MIDTQTKHIDEQLPGEYRSIGHSAARTDGKQKVTGETRFAGDLKLPGMLHARLVLSLHAHARIRSIDASEALKVPGVVKVVTATELASVLKGSQDSRKGSPLAKDETIFYGQPVAVVLGETEAVALDGANLVNVDYDVLPPVVDLLRAFDSDAPTVRKKGGHGADSEAQAHATVDTSASQEKIELPPNVSNRFHFHRGDVEAGFKEAAVITENTLHLPMVHQSYLETQSIVATTDPLGGIVVYASTQGGFWARREIAAALDVQQEDIKVVSMPIGGGFGGKIGLIEPWGAALAKLSGRPVKLSFYRMEDMLAGNPLLESQIQIKVGARADGTLCAIKARLIYNTGAYSGSPAAISALLLGGYYRFDNLDIESFEVFSHKVGAGAYRGPGAPQAAFAIETQIDILARTLKMDPLEFRIKNCVVEGDLNTSGQPWPTLGLKECLERLQQHPAWQQRDHKDQDEGIGIALGGWPGGLEPAAAICRLNPDGKITVVTGASDISGVSTSFRAIAAEMLGMAPEMVNVQNVDTDSAPYAGVSGGSKTTLTVGAAVLKAAREAREQILEIAGQKLEASPDDLDLKDGEVSVRGLPSRKVSIKEIASMSMSFGGRYEPVMGRGGSAITRNSPGFGVHLAKVKVDRETGEVKIVNYVVAQDVGFPLNPAEVEGQIHGGVVQGLGWALYEQMVYDESGALLSGSLMDYALQNAPQVPPIEVLLVQVPSPDGPFGAKGVGEPPIIPGGAAIANAIYDATGARITELPAIPERVLKALHQNQDF